MSLIKWSISTQPDWQKEHFEKLNSVLGLTRTIDLIVFRWVLKYLLRAKHAFSHYTFRFSVVLFEDAIIFRSKHQHWLYLKLTRFKDFSKSVCEVFPSFRYLRRRKIKEKGRRFLSTLQHFVFSVLNVGKFTVYTQQKAKENEIGHSILLGFCFLLGSTSVHKAFFNIW